MKNWSMKQRVVTFTSALGVGAMLLGAYSLTGANAEDPATPAAVARPEAATWSGRVKEVIRNRQGDIDGLKLDGDREIHFPPHLGEEVGKLAVVGDEIKVQVTQETRPAGEVVWEAQRIENKGKVLNIERPEPKPGRGPQAKEVAMNAQEKVRELTKNPHGDVDGLTLGDGTLVKFPPHQGRELERLIHDGDEVRIAGRRHETPRGEIHLHADKITVVRSGEVIERAEPARRPGPHHGPHHGPHGPGPREAAEAPPTREQFDEILRELREVRKLLEAQRR